MLTFDYGPELLRGIVDTELKKLVVGKDPRDISGIWQACYSHCEYIGQSGVAAWGLRLLILRCGICWVNDWVSPWPNSSVQTASQVSIYGSGGWLSYSMDELLAEAKATCSVVSRW